jgi:hypothetical protein
MALRKRINFMNVYLKKCLEEAGWSEDREIVIDYMIEEVAKIGYPTDSSYLCDFLQKFGNLLIEFETPDSRISCVRTGIESIHELYPDEASKLSGLVQKQIIPVGFIHYESALLLISCESGSFYMTTYKGFYKLGNDFIETLEMIVYEKDIIRIETSS